MKTGMENVGNSCYIASVLQMLLLCNPLRERYTQAGNSHLQSCKKKASMCFACQMSKMMIGLSSGEYSIEKTEEVEIPSTGEKTTTVIV